jgi:hypothetical protein
MTFPNTTWPTALNVNPTTPTVLHRTITGLWGMVPPPAAHADWMEQPAIYLDLHEEDQITRFYVDLVIRGATGLADDPIITFRPYVRNGGVTGVVAAGQPVTFTRPRLKDLTTIKYQKTVNIGVAYTDYSAVVIDNNVATFAVLSALDTVANGDWLVVGGPVPFCGAAIDMTANVNVNASVLTAEYWNGAAWVALTNLVDGTIAVAGRTHSGDGQLSWTMPAAGLWAASTIATINAYWVRLSVSAALSAAVEVCECDLIMPMRCGIDFHTDQDAAMLCLESQDAVVTGTLVYDGTIRCSWR